MTIRIAMWSGPRNLSTAMMRAFENRVDCSVVDEPFYAAYLAATGIDHPMRDEVLAAYETNAEAVAAACARGASTALEYQKHMTQHMAEGWIGAWTTTCRHAFLIRAPERVLASYALKREDVTEADIGYLRQLELYKEITRRTGSPPPVIEAEDVRRAPEPSLRKLCAALGISFDHRMLEWPSGRRESDGLWAAHWYGAVERSTGFSPPPSDALPELPGHLQAIAEIARPAFEALQARKL